MYCLHVYTTSYSSLRIGRYLFLYVVIHFTYLWQLNSRFHRLNRRFKERTRFWDIMFAEKQPAIIIALGDRRSFVHAVALLTSKVDCYTCITTCLYRMSKYFNELCQNIEISTFLQFCVLGLLGKISEKVMTGFFLSASNL